MPNPSPIGILFPSLLILKVGINPKTGKILVDNHNISKIKTKSAILCLKLRP